MGHLHPQLTLGTLVAACLSAPALAADLHVDAAGAPGTFATLSGAIAAAAPGDRIFVAAGDYAEIVQVDKPLRILAEAGTVLRLPPSQSTTNLTIRDLAAGEEVLVSGIQVVGAASGISFPGFEPHAVQVINTAGRVVLHALDVDTTAFSALIAINTPQLLLLDCAFDADLTAAQSCSVYPLVQVAAANLVVSNSEFRGANAFIDPTCHRPGMPAFQATGASLVAQNSLFVGGSSSVQLITAKDGAPAVVAGGGSVVDLRGSTLVGGNGGIVYPSDILFDGAIGDGAPALALTGGSAALLADLTSATGGLSGDGLFQSASTSVDTGSAVQTSGIRYPTLDLVSPNPLQVAPGWNVTLALGGHPGDVQFLLLAGAASAPLSIPGLAGEFLLNPIGLTNLGAVVIHSTGASFWNATVPNQPALIGVTAYFQTVAPIGPTPAVGNLVLVPIGG
ncbi:MAG: hypothetical protein GC161_10125 [Planctomycetaceae bacterium]|nr:hypothetical protein [Planctomycetaceae bacterium]